MSGWAEGLPVDCKAVGLRFRTTVGPDLNPQNVNLEGPKP